MRAKTEQRTEAIRLRIEEHLSLGEIEARLGASKASLSVWLRPHPLTAEERAARRVRNHRGGVIAYRHAAAEPSPFFLAVRERTLTNKDKGRIAEAAVLFRLALHGFDLYRALFEGDKADFVVALPGVGVGQGEASPADATPVPWLARVQVRWATRAVFGRPVINLRCANGARRYEPGDFDFLVGYDLFTDTAYVYAASEVAHLRAGVSVSDAAAERWDKLLARGGI